MVDQRVGCFNDLPFVANDQVAAKPYRFTRFEFKLGDDLADIVIAKAIGWPGLPIFPIAFVDRLARSPGTVNRMVRLAKRLA